MRKASAIVSWIVWIIKTVIGFIYLSVGQVVRTRTYNYYTGSYSTTAEVIPYSGWVWFIWIIWLIGDIVFLTWRRNKLLDDGRKVACGLWTLFFISIIGGILTMRIPDEDLVGYSAGTSHSSNYNSPKTTYINLGRPKKDNQLPVLRVEGSTTYYNLGAPKKQEPKDAEVNVAKISESEKIDLLKEYKKLLDDGVITQEEFDNKKKELL